MEPDQSQYRQHGLDGAGYGLFLCAVVLQSIVVMALSIRLLSRKMSNAGIGPDDWAIVVSVVSYVFHSLVSLTYHMFWTDFRFSDDSYHYCR